MSEAVYTASHFFAEDQDIELAAEAVRLARVFADRTFLRAANPDSLLLRDWSHYVRFNRRNRLNLDSVLQGYAYAPGPNGTARGMPEASRLAGMIETFVLPSMALECRVFEHPTESGRTGYIIALSALMSETMANICWTLPALYSFYQPREEPQASAEGLQEYFRQHAPSQDAVRAMDEAIESLLRPSAQAGHKLTAPLSVVPRSGPGVGINEASRAAEATHAACQNYLLAHEFAHVIAGHFAPAAELVTIPPFLRDLPQEMKREVHADCLAVVLTMNSLLARGADSDSETPPDIPAMMRTGPVHGLSRRPGKRRRQQKAIEDARLLTRCATLASDACMSFYAATDLFSALARARGDEAAALRLDQVIARRDLVRQYAQAVREASETEVGIVTWFPQETQNWGFLDQHIDHLKQTLVPPLTQRPPLPSWLKPPQ